MDMVGANIDRMERPLSQLTVRSNHIFNDPAMLVCHDKHGVSHAHSVCKLEFWIRGKFWFGPIV